MHLLLALRRFFVFRGLILVAIIALTIWLSVSSNPSNRRERLLNELISKGELGKTNPVLEKRLRTQFTWLAQHAGVRLHIGVNTQITRDQLTLIVTTPQYETLTNCGSGNAIYDPSLNAIFVDQSLLWPTEVNIIGTPSVNSMFTVDAYGYVVSYTSFILAHELGHWQKRHRASAFFYYGWGDGTASLAEEKAADRSAVATIFAGRAAGDEPPGLRKLDALSAIGLGSTQLTARESAAADILGGMVLMTNDLLFSSSPFSPYYSNRSHPDMLERADEAIREVEVAPPGASLKAETGLVQAELRRFAALGDWDHRELFLPGPLTVADFRAGYLWLGRTDIPSVGTVKLEEQISRVPFSAISPAGNRSGGPLASSVVKTGYSKVGEEYHYADNFGTWVESEFEHGDQTIGLPRAEPSQDPQPEKDWGRSRWGGLELLGTAWRWPARGKTPEGRVTERYLMAQLQRLIAPGKTLAIGPLQWHLDAVVVPVVSTGANDKTELRLFQLSASEPFRLTEHPEFGLSSSGKIDVSAAKLWGANLWVPVRFSESQPGYRMELWRISPSQPQLFDTATFLVGRAGVNLTESPSRMLPDNPRFVPISGGRAIFGYDHDSLYLVDERVGHLKLLFHPASGGLRLVDLGSGCVMFWNLHARKAYIINTEKG